MSDATPQSSGPNWSDLGPRLGSAAVLLAVAMFAVWVNGPLFAIAVSIVFAGIYREWEVMVRTRPLSSFGYVLTGIMTLVPIAAMIGGSGPAWLIVGFGIVVAAFFGLEHLMWRAFGLIFLSAVAISIVAIRGDGSPGFAACFFLGSTVWMTDTGAFFVGRQMGGAKLSPGISPGKTWTGAFGGLIVGTLTGLLFWIWMTPSPWWIGALIAAATSVAGQLGDLSESAVKRRFRVKDSGDLIPGHGGFMDRLDSLTFGALFVFVVGYLHMGPDMVPAGLLHW
ncbi:MAG: phosphatidate cytidylyltransferase [Hyphomicrobiaceae bacterium]|nr:phosphatidate cytidylyltransferase [Hyphomicrobiaceae bacterium]